MMGNIVKEVPYLWQPCQIHSKPSQQQALPVIYVPRGKTFFKWELDLVGPLAKTANKNQHLVTALDYGTGWAYADPIPCTAAAAVIFC